MNNEEQGFFSMYLYLIKYLLYIEDGRVPTNFGICNLNLTINIYHQYIFVLIRT